MTNYIVVLALRLWWPVDITKREEDSERHSAF